MGNLYIKKWHKLNIFFHNRYRKEMKILVSDPNSKIGLAVIRSLNTDKHHIEMFSNQNKPMCYYSN